MLSTPGDMIMNIFIFYDKSGIIPEFYTSNDDT